MNSIFTRVASLTRRLPGRIHRCQGGAMSILSVFTVLFLTMLLGMVMNVGRQVDSKVRMQNAADAVAYSGGAAIARGMSALAFSNHFLCDVFALTAYCREAQDHHSDKYASDILDKWEEVAKKFAGVVYPVQPPGLPSTRTLEQAIRDQVSDERELVARWSEFLNAFSVIALPVLEQILQQEMVPNYQRTLLQAWPSVAQMTAMEVAKREGSTSGQSSNDPHSKRGYLMGALWRTNGTVVGGDSWTLPAVDPTSDVSVSSQAKNDRLHLSHHYLDVYNNANFCNFFDGYAPLSQFNNLWRCYTCWQLEKLLDEYPDSNLPHVIRSDGSLMVDANSFLEEDFTFVGVAYWKRVPDYVSGLFQNPLDADSVAYAEVRVFVPKSLLYWQPHWFPRPGGGGGNKFRAGGMGGQTISWGSDTGGGESTPPDWWTVERLGTGWTGGRERKGWSGNYNYKIKCGSTDWSLLNQNWSAQIVAAASPNVASIIQSTPSLPDFSGASFDLPRLGNLSTNELQRISPH